MDIAGWGRREIAVVPRGHAMQGYGMWHNRAFGKKSALFARAFFIAAGQGGGLFFCCLDAGYVTNAMREGVCREMKRALGPVFREESFVLTCTHTHSGPGGCTHDALYNIVTPGFVPENLDCVVDASVAAMMQAYERAQPTRIRLSGGRFGDDVAVAWNRSLRAYNRNPDVSPQDERHCHLAIDRNMHVLGFYREDRLCALLSLFGVHATCVGNALQNYDGDNKGYASSHAEAVLADAGSVDAVAIFAQATAGDVSPYYHGPGQAARRKRTQGEAEYAYARRNGEMQAAQALALCAAGGLPVSAQGDAVLSYVDFSVQTADPRFAGGERQAHTSDPCHGVAFFAGTPVDGPAMPRPLAAIAGVVADLQRRVRLSAWSGRRDAVTQRYYQRLYAAQGPKQILLEAGRKKILGQALGKLMLPGFVDPLVRELKQQARRGAIGKSALVPTVLPLQIVRLGTLALVCCPGEFTTVAGRRVIAAVQEELRGAGVEKTLICTYCNEYMGYVTTREEYQVQAYEGGHTIFGQWTLAVFQSRFADLARQLRRREEERTHDRMTRPAPCPPGELALRSNLAVPV